MDFLHSLAASAQSLLNSTSGAFHNVEGLLQSHAYQAPVVYAIVIAFFLLSGFGMPIPEEVILIGAGLVAFMAQHPELYPPLPGMNSPVDPYVLAGICFGAVMVADLSVFFIGKYFGRRLLINRRFRKIVKPQLVRKVRGIVKKNGNLASGIFRFTPGIRFPGHLICGMSRLSPWKFALIDGAAALISVPTQVLLIATYGDEILKSLKTFKITIFSILGILLIYFIVRRLYRNRRQNRLLKSQIAPK